MVGGFPLIWVKLKLSDIVEAKQTRPGKGQTFKSLKVTLKESSIRHKKCPTNSEDILHSVCVLVFLSLAATQLLALLLPLKLQSLSDCVLGKGISFYLHHGWCQNSQFLHHLKEITRPSEVSSEISMFNSVQGRVSSTERENNFKQHFSNQHKRAQCWNQKTILALCPLLILKIFPGVLLYC